MQFRHDLSAFHGIAWSSGFQRHTLYAHSGLRKSVIMQVQVQSRVSDANQYSVVKAMIAASKRFKQQAVVLRSLSLSTARRLSEEGYRIARRGRGDTSFMLIIW